MHLLKKHTVICIRRYSYVNVVEEDLKKGGAVEAETNLLTRNVSNEYIIRLKILIHDRYLYTQNTGSRYDVGGYSVVLGSFQSVRRLDPTLYCQHCFHGPLA